MVKGSGRKPEGVDLIISQGMIVTRETTSTTRNVGRVYLDGLLGQFMRATSLMIIGMVMVRCKKNALKI